MKVIFLDFDGVIVTPPKVRSLNKGCCDNLKQIIDETDSFIVISSCWRNLHPLDYLKRKLAEKGISRKRVIGITPRGNNRDEEVQQWLDNNPVDAFVILDDDVFDLQEHIDKVIQTNFEVGLTGLLAEKAVAVLNGTGKG